MFGIVSEPLEPRWIWVVDDDPGHLRQPPAILTRCGCATAGTGLPVSVFDEGRRAVAALIAGGHQPSNPRHPEGSLCECVFYKEDTKWGEWKNDLTEMKPGVHERNVRSIPLATRSG